MFLSLKYQNKVYTWHYYLGYARHVEDPHPAVQLALIFPDVPPVNISETSDDENEDE